MIPRWAVDVLSCVGFVFIWCIIATAAGILIGRWLRACRPQTPAPAADPPRVPGPDPGEGRPDCGPVHAGIGFSRDGCMYTWEPSWGYWQHKQHRLPFNVDDWEAKL